MYTRVLTPGLSAAPTTMDHSPPDLSISPHRRDSFPFYFHPPADTKLLPTSPSLPPSPIVTTTTNNIPHHQPTTHVNEHLQVQTVQTMNLPLTHYEEVNVLPVAAHHMNTAHNQDHNQGVSPLWSSATTTTSSSSRSSRSNSNSNSSETNSNLNDWERSPEPAFLLSTSASLSSNSTSGSAYTIPSRPTTSSGLRIVASASALRIFDSNSPPNSHSQLASKRSGLFSKSRSLATSSTGNAKMIFRFQKVPRWLVIGFLWKCF